MKKAGILIVPLLIILVVVVFQRNMSMDSKKGMVNESDNIVTSDKSIPKDDSKMENTEGSMMPNKYLHFSPENLNSAATNRRVLFFYASWCPTCRPADAEFSTMTDKIPADVTIIRVNYNDDDTDQAEKDLAKLYKVTYQHTYVQIDSSGREITKWNGGAIDELLTNLN